jgi:hypothetical protein
MAGPFNPVDAKTGAILAGVRKDFVGVYKPILRDSDIDLQSIMDLGKTSTGRSERYAYPEAPPGVPRWDYGNDMPRGTFRYRQWTVQNLRWAKAIDYEADDAADDQLDVLTTQATEMASRLGLLPMRVAMQIVQGGAADPELLNGLPLAPDGVSMYSALDGDGNNRYGRSANGGGNIVTKTGMASEAQIEKDAFAVLHAAKSVTDTAGRRRWPASLVDKGLVVLGSSVDGEVLTKTFNRGPMTQAGIAGAGVAAGVNTVMGGVVKKLILTAELPTGSWYPFLAGAPYMPLFRQVREEANVYYGDKSNSDRARDQDTNSFYVKGRYGFGVFVCDGAFKVA